MAFDEQLASRMRTALSNRTGITEKRMFGGLAFLLHRNMAVVASGQGGMMVRVGADAAQSLLARSGVEPVEMRGRPMRGWLRVAAGRLKTEKQLGFWIERGIDFTTGLSAK